MAYTIFFLDYLIRGQNGDGSVVVDGEDVPFNNERLRAEAIEMVGEFDDAYEFADFEYWKSEFLESEFLQTLGSGKQLIKCVVCINPIPTRHK